jgi:O-antigen/teichoic acid export membrane protein
VPLVVTAAGVRGVLEAAQRFDLVNMVRAPVTAANFLLPLAGVLAGWRLAGVVALLVAARAVALAAYIGLALRVAPALARRPAARRQAVARALRFGGWTTVSGVASPLLIYADRFLVGALVSIAAVAYYTAPYEVAARLLIVPASLVGTLFPAFSRLHGRNDLDEAARLGARGVKYTLLLVGPIAVLLIAVAPDLLHVWLGEPFAREGAVALQLLAAGIVVNAVAHVPVSLLHGIGRADLPARFHLLELPVHVTVASVLVMLLGVPGAALAWCLRACLDATLLFAAARRVTPLSHAVLRSERVPQTALLLAGIAAAAASATLLPTPLLRISAGVAATLVAAGSSWRYAVGAVERARLLRMLAPASAR